MGMQVQETEKWLPSSAVAGRSASKPILRRFIRPAYREGTHLRVQRLNAR